MKILFQDVMCFERRCRDATAPIDGPLSNSNFPRQRLVGAFQMQVQIYISVKGKRHILSVLFLKHRSEEEQE